MSLTGLEHARVEPIALTARQRLQAERQAVERDGAAVAVGDLTQTEALDVARVLVLGLDAGERDPERGFAGMAPGIVGLGEVQRLCPGRPPTPHAERARAQPPGACEPE